MPKHDAFAVFDSLTEKQHITLTLASRHLTSKQIAIELAVAPVTIDKRIETVRARLGLIPRSELLHLYSEWLEGYDRIIDDPIILVSEPAKSDGCGAPPARFALSFEDSLSFDARTSWDRERVWLRPGLKPSDLGVSGKLLVIAVGAVAIMMVAVLSIAFADALMSMLSR
jgi:DNA-binding CsgD family transcriptional regulator